MRSHTLAAAAVMATTALASNTMMMALPRELHVFLPLEVRQAGGGNVSPGQYACHDACGNAILGATGDYCTSQAWITRFEKCMECANDFGIWKWYAEGVTQAAKGCGRDAVPDPADASSSAGGGSTASSTATAGAATTATTAVTTGTTSAAATQGSATGGANSSSSAAAVPSGTSSGAAAPPASATPTVSATIPLVPSSATANNSTATSAIPIAAAGALELNSGLALGVAGVAAFLGAL
ncbi:hypothetical protein Micbo1qcDRAFT_194777 [Microdochium bolleyi]|uniref:Extracellular membrane protein CFEM domain-containing protein n=1 Tax=Microdochium bolleyi TaxID=196109 RepID=A0A136J3N8_9PEZI|nr:hypothetical protein Micbo1qcDRAFT_194777 [Microdochium bolleyi]